MILVREAMKLTGVAKPTIHKAIKTGRLSAIKDGRGRWEIDPAELFRVYPAITDTQELKEIESHEIAKLTSLLAEKRADIIKWQDQADSWRRQAERLTLLLGSDEAKKDNQFSIRSILGFK